MLAGKTYVPVLHTRSAEIKGLEKLPDATKDLLFPLLMARPWPNANHLSKTWEKISAAFGQRRFALDLDAYKRNSNSEKLAAKEFDRLFDQEDGHSAYYQEVAGLANAVPVLQLVGGEVPNLNDQLARVEHLDRGLVLHLQHGLTQNPAWLATVVRQAYPDTCIILDLGWSPDLIGRELWASAILTALAETEEEQEVVVAGSSFPESFRSKARDELRAEERVVFDSLRRRHNSIVLTYGDWGSTRPPKDPTPMGSIPPRIDLPKSREWIAFRRDGSETYRQIATRVKNDTAWPNDLNIWGTYQISATAEGVPDSIRGQTAAAAVRVNIHLHEQAHFGAPGSFGDTDEPFIDEF